MKTTTLPFGLKHFSVREPESGWFKTITAKSEQQAIDKAWCQYWEKLPLITCRKSDLTAKETM